MTDTQKLFEIQSRLDQHDPEDFDRECPDDTFTADDVRFLIGIINRYSNFIVRNIELLNQAEEGK